MRCRFFERRRGMEPGGKGSSSRSRIASNNVDFAALGRWETSSSARAESLSSHFSPVAKAPQDVIDRGIVAFGFTPLAHDNIRLVLGHPVGIFEERDFCLGKLQFGSWPRRNRGPIAPDCSSHNRLRGCLSFAHCVNFNDSALFQLGQGFATALFFRELLHQGWDGFAPVAPGRSEI